MKGNKTARAARVRRHVRVRKTLVGTPEKPRLDVFRSVNHIYAQIIDDTAGHTLVAASDLDKDLRSAANGKKKTEVAEAVGESLAKKAKEAGIQTVVFDRGGFMFHGRVKALAEAARKGGLSF
ncbi:MAG TPA: 50S ribosomal protein L18 [Dehalococcoidia bacterium]|nr:50S ribosomal protein L18 [Dehalococcoidia bacterium]